MRWILLTVLLAQGDSLTGQWVGPLEMTVQGPTKTRGAIPTDVEMTQTGDTIEGHWRSRPPNTASGTISGTVDKPVVVFYADSMEKPEACKARVTFSGRYTAAKVYRLTETRIEPDPRKECGPWPTDLVWLLQRH